VKLEGVRVVDLTVFLPGPFLTQALADHGAEVIKVEPPQGDPSRRLGPADGPSTAYFRCLNRGKKSVVLDLKRPHDRDALLELADSADVFVEGFRPGVAERLGLGYGTLSARNPRIVYCSLSAFGQEGPYRDRPAHDLAIEALAGVLSMTLGADGEPALPAVPAADLIAALQGLAGVLMALLRRAATGRGDYLDVALQESLVTALPNILGAALAENRQPDARLERTTGGAAFYRIYRTRDGQHIALGGQEMKFVRALLEALGRPDFVPLCERGPGEHQRPVIEFLRATFLTRTRAEWEERLRGLDLCYGPVNTLPEALADPQLAVRGTVLADELGRRHLGSPIRFRDEPARPDLREPPPGAHTAEYLRRTRAWS
jgi:crotonobetainyl-CoA:carnitine CoA-transferase CaiB-like acyl-CoA transferase